MKNKPVILITNDDGVNAKGLRALVDSLKDLGELIVFAPDGPRSGMSSAITSLIPIRYKKIEQVDNVTIYSCTGMPVDCVKLAVHTGIRPDIVVSGINHGGNMSVCVHYSGTMGAAIEGCILDIPSIGVSLADYTENSDFGESCRMGRKAIEYIIKEGLPRGTYLNLNVPNRRPVKGLRVCEQAEARFINEYRASENALGHPVYWLTGSLSVHPPFKPEYDTEALDAGYASLVPCKIDVTDYNYIEHLKKIE
jgi:5'-nucleotidase